MTPHTLAYPMLPCMLHAAMLDPLLLLLLALALLLLPLPLPLLLTARPGPGPWCCWPPC